MTTATTPALCRIIIVGKQSDVRELARPHTEQMFASDDVDDVWNIIDTVSAELILFDYAVPRDEITRFLETARAKSIDTPVVILGSENDDRWSHYRGGRK